MGPPPAGIAAMQTRLRPAARCVDVDSETGVTESAGCSADREARDRFALAGGLHTPAGDGGQTTNPRRCQRSG